MMWWTKSENKKKEEISNKLFEIVKILQIKINQVESEVQEIQLKIKKKIFKKELDQPDEEEKPKEPVFDDGFDELRNINK